MIDEIKNTDNVVSVVDLPEGVSYRRLSRPIPYKKFVNQVVEVVHLWKPIGIYKNSKDSDVASTPLQEIHKTLIERLGVDITVKTLDEGYQQRFVQCTDDLWDELMEKQIYRILEDRIFLKFNADGIAFAYALKESPLALDELPPSEQDEAIKSRFKSAKDILRMERKSNRADSNMNDTLNGCIIFEKISDNSKITISPKIVPSDVKPETANKIAKYIYDYVLANKGIKSLDILPDDYIVTDVRADDRYIYINKIK